MWWAAQSDSGRSVWQWVVGFSFGRVGGSVVGSASGSSVVWFGRSFGGAVVVGRSLRRSVGRSFGGVARSVVRSFGGAVGRRPLGGVLGRRSFIQWG